MILTMTWSTTINTYDETMTLSVTVKNPCCLDKSQQKNEAVVQMDKITLLSAVLSNATVTINTTFN
jgi:hypothetical protein